jgi:hypothetical protein
MQGEFGAVAIALNIADRGFRRYASVADLSAFLVTLLPVAAFDWTMARERR